MIDNLEEDVHMANDRYQKGMDKLMELVTPDENNRTGHMDIGEGFKDVAPDLEKYVVEFDIVDIYVRPGLDNKQKILTTIFELVEQALTQIEIHVKTGIQVGLKPEEIVGCIMHLITYACFPKAQS